MATHTTIFLPHNSKLQFSHSLTFSNSFHYQVGHFSLRCSGFTVSHAIRSPKYDLNPRNFDEDEEISRSKRKTRKFDRRSKQRRWWSDEDEVEEEEDSEVDVGIFEQVVDSLWILRVLKSYGWFSPIILSSLLIATGLKAFLLAFSIPFGLSMVIFTFQKLREWLVGSSKPQRRHKRSNFGRRTDEEDDQEENQQGKRNKKRNYQSWAVRNNGSFNKSGSGSRVNVNSFGGWDDLVGEDGQNTQKPSQETGRLETMMEKERLSRSMKERDLPMLLRLLIATFPFLASWTNFQ